MSDEPIGNPKIEIDADFRKAIREFLNTGKASKDVQKAVEELATALDTKLNGKVDKSERAMAAFEKRVHKLGAEITGQGATAKLGELEHAIDKVGGRAKLTEKQLEALERRYRSLIDQGGKASSALAAQFVKTPALNLGQAVKAESMQQIAGMASDLGPAAAPLMALGPGGIAAAAGLAAVTAAAAKTGAVIADLTKQAVDYGDSISDAMAATRMTAESTQILEHAFAKTGKPIEFMTAAVLKMQAALVTAPDKFEALGLSVADLRRLAPEQQLATIGRALNSLEDDERRSAIARSIFGKSWQELADVMSGGLDSMEDFQPLSAEQIAQLDALKQATAGTEVEWERLTRAFGVALATTPGLKEGIQTLADVLEESADIAQKGAPFIRLFFDAFLTKGALQALETGMRTIQAAKAGYEEIKKTVGGAAEAAGLDDPFAEMPELTKNAPKPPSGEPGQPATPSGTKVESLDKTAGKDLDNKTRDRIKAINDAAAANAELIRLEKELATAVAAGAVGLEASIGKIRASADAKRAEIAANDSYTRSEKQRLLAVVTATEQVQISLAETAAARQTAAEATGQHQEAERLINETLEAGMTPLEQKLKKIEATRLAEIASAHAVFNKAQAEGRDTEELRKNTNEHIRAANGWAKGATDLAKLTDKQKGAAAAAKIHADAEKSLQATMERGHASLNNRIGAINAEIDARIAALEKQRDGNAETEREIDLAIKLANAERARLIQLEQAAQKLADLAAIGDILNSVADVMETLEVKGADVFRVIADGWMAGAAAAKAYAEASGKAEKAAVVADAAAGAIGRAYESKSVWKGAAGGAGTGAQVGNQVAPGGMGAMYGAMIGAVVGGVAGWIGDSKDKTDDIIEDLAHEWGVDISQELAAAIQDTMRELDIGKRAAELLHLDEIFAAAGGVMQFGLEEAIDKTRELFAHLSFGTLTVEEVGEAFEKVFGEIAANSISKTTGIAADGLRELVALSRQFGIESAGVADYMSQQTSEAVENAKSAIAGSAIVSPEAARAFGSSVRLLYDELIRQGFSRDEALEQIGPVVDELRAKLKAAGLEGSDAFKELDGIVAFFSDKVSGPLGHGISATIGLMVNLHNMNALTEEGFKGLATQVGSNYEKLRALGSAGPTALAAIAPDLQKLWELQQKTGYAVDANTQKLIDEAKAAGLVGEEHMSTEDKMLAGIEALTLAIENMGRALLGLPPLTEVEVKTKYTSSGQQGGGGGVPGDNDGNGIPDDHPGNNHLGSFAVGTTRVKGTGYAKIHTGEAIIPAHINPFTGGGVGEMLAWGGLGGVTAPPSIGVSGGGAGASALQSSLGKLEARFGEMLGEQKKQTAELRNMPFSTAQSVRDALQKVVGL